MIDVLLLGRTHGYDALRNAVEKTVGIGCMDVSAVELLLKGPGSELRPTVETVDIGDLSRYDRPQPTLTDYDQLLRQSLTRGEDEWHSLSADKVTEPPSFRATGVIQ